MILDDVIEQVAARLRLIPGLSGRVFAYPPDSLTPPAAVVAYPETYTYDTTYDRGSDELTLPVVLVVGRVTDRSTRKQLTLYANGSGASSVKATLESGDYPAFDFVRVASVEFDAIKIAETDYMAALFTLEITGDG